MESEFDAQKSLSNKQKHGIDFNEAQALWDDENRAELDAKPGNEPRILVIGKIGGKHWTAVVTPRGEKTRIISVRRSRKEEVETYES